MLIYLHGPYTLRQTLILSLTVGVLTKTKANEIWCELQFVYKSMFQVSYFRGILVSLYVLPPNTDTWLAGHAHGGSRN